MKQLVMAIVAATANNITFAFFMLHDVYCKINEYHAKFLLQKETLIGNSLKNKTDSFGLQKVFAEAWPIVAEHLACVDKAKKKLPAMWVAGCLFAKIPYEQSTSELVAAFHAKIAGKQRILSITGGLGVDDIAFSRAGADVTSIEPDPGLNALFEYNARQLDLRNVLRSTNSAENYLKSNQQSFDLVFADPDRRPQGKKAHGNAVLYSPDVFDLMEKYPDIASTWMIKLSPLTDIDWLRKRVQTPMDVHVVSVDHEVKEVLCLIGKHAENLVLQHDIREGGIFTWNGEPLHCDVSEERLFFEVRPATIKSGFHKKIEALFGLKSENTNQTYFTGNTVLPGALARSFQLEQKLSGSLNSMVDTIRSMGILKANISCRNFVMDAEEMKKKTGLKDGGNQYLFFTGKGEKICFVCKKDQ